ncbi:glycoside hydrolase family 18 protein [Maribellus sediminis]|uniref:glycoside hydrolase family 18 protein n=1 Tax=Maribellus sediminis TaxID=2696285 RepID=UPI001431CE8F|nr:glycoside hydrolase family 18 protein [Maribellus sediminis]
MKFSILIVVTLFAFISFTGCKPAQKPKAESNSKEYMVVAYVAGYRDFDFSTIDVSGITHINYAFGNIRDGEAVFDTTKIDGKNLTPDDLVKLNGLKSKNPDLKILVSIGGWSWSGGFSDAALTESSRKRFAESCARFVKDYQLDGIDLDWEYPNQVGAGNIHRPEDVHNFTLMLKAVREELDNLTVESDGEKHYLLSIATGADKAYVDNTELGKLGEYLDFLNIMTYDFYNGLHHVNGHHSNLNPSAQPDLDMNSVVNAVDLHTKAGFPVERINLGIPFYGRIWKGVEADGNQILFNKAETVGMGIDYVDFFQNINANGYTRYWDDTAKAPYLWNPEKKEFISYEDEESIAYKIDYLKKRGLAGIMFWEYSADHDKVLLNAALSNLKK